MLLRKVHEILTEHNREVQLLNSNPSVWDYNEKIEKSREKYNKKILDLIESEHYKILSKGS